MTAVHRGLVSLVPLLFLTGCIHPRPMRNSDAHGERTVLTEEQITRSGASNAWDVLKRLAPQFSFGEDRNGQPRRLERRGLVALELRDARRARTRHALGSPSVEAPPLSADVAALPAAPPVASMSAAAADDAPPF